MFGEVYQLGGFADAAQRGFGDGFRFARDGDHAAIVIGVTFAIK